MAKKKKNKSAAVVVEKQPKQKKDLPTQELSFTLTVPQRLAHQLWEMRHHWNVADPGWNWIKPIFMSIVLARLQAGMRSQIPALMEVGQKISSATPMVKLSFPSIVRDATGHLLEAVIEPNLALRELQIRLGQSIILAGFSLQEKGGLPRPRVLLARRQEGQEPSCIQPTEAMTITDLSWVASKVQLVEGRQGHDPTTITSLNAWLLARSAPSRPL